MLWFFWQEIQNRYRTSTGIEPVDVRWCRLWFFGQEIQRQISPVPEIPDSRLFILTSKRRFVTVWSSLNQGFRGLDIAHRLTNRIGRCAMMHVVIFLANRYKSRYRTSTGIESVDVPWCTLCSMWETTFPRNSQDWLGRDFTESKWFKRNWWYLAQIQVLTYDDALR